MAAKVKQEEDDDDEISILHTIPNIFIKRTATQSAAKIIIDISDDDDDDDVTFASISGKTRRIYKGESSDSKHLYDGDDDDDDTVLRRSFTCEICTDAKPLSDSFRIIGCYHSYCTQCLSKYVAAKLQENTIVIKCPAPGCCDGVLEAQHCRTILPKEVFDRWGDALCEAMILSEEKFYCPFKDCSALMLVDGGGVGLLESNCPNCNRLFCVQCKVPWHSGIDCTEFKRQRASERNDGDVLLVSLATTQGWGGGAPTAVLCLQDDWLQPHVMQVWKKFLLQANCTTCE